MKFSKMCVSVIEKFISSYVEKPRTVFNMFLILLSFQLNILFKFFRNGYYNDTLTPFKR